MFHLSTNFRIR